MKLDNFTTIELIELTKDVKDERLVEEIHSEIAWRVFDFEHKPELKLAKSENNIDYYEEKPKDKGKKLVKIKKG